MGKKSDKRLRALYDNQIKISDEYRRYNVGLEKEIERLKEENEEIDGLAMKMIDGLKQQLKEAEDMLSNISYWETCPEDYKDRIKKLLTK